MVKSILQTVDDSSVRKQRCPALADKLEDSFFSDDILKADNRKGISEISAKIRKVIEETAIPKGIENEITRHLEQLGERNAYAVRSSATAEIYHMPLLPVNKTPI